MWNPVLLLLLVFSVAPLLATHPYVPSDAIPNYDDLNDLFFGEMRQKRSDAGTVDPGMEIDNGLEGSGSDCLMGSEDCMETTNSTTAPGKTF